MPTLKEFTIQDVLDYSKTTLDPTQNNEPARKKFGKQMPKFINGTYMKKKFREATLLKHGEGKDRYNKIWLVCMNRIDKKHREKIRKQIKTNQETIEKLNDESESLYNMLETIPYHSSDTYDSDDLFSDSDSDN